MGGLSSLKRGADEHQHIRCKEYDPGGEDFGVRAVFGAGMADFGTHSSRVLRHLSRYVSLFMHDWEVVQCFYTAAWPSFHLLFDL